MPAQEGQTPNKMTHHNSQEDRTQEVEVPGDTEDVAVPDDEAEDKGVMGITSGILT